MKTLLRYSSLSLLSLLAAVRLGGAAGPDASWLPASTVGYVWLTEPETFLTAAKATAPGKLLDSKPFEDFFKSVWEGQEKDPHSVAWLQGLTLEEVRQIGSGSLVLAVVPGSGRPPALVLLLDVQKRQKQAAEVLHTVVGRLEKLGAKRRQNGQVLACDLPDKFALGSLKQLAYAFKDGILIASNQPAVVQDILARKGGATLADSPVYQATTARALKETPGALGCFFIDPLGCWRTWRGLLAEKVRGQDWLKILEKEGFSAIKGAGGAISIARSGEVVVRGLVRAPRPYQRSMRMLTFTNDANIVPPAWVPADAAIWGRRPARFALPSRPTATSSTLLMARAKRASSRRCSKA